MAQTPPSTGRPGRQLLVLGTFTLLLFALMFFSGTSGMSWQERMEPRLGLDLIGGTRVALLAVTPDGGDPDESSLEVAREIIESRVNALGVEEAEVVTEGGNQIVVSVAGQGEDSLRSVGDPAELRFRKVLEQAPGDGLPPEPPSDPQEDVRLHRSLGDRGGPPPQPDTESEPAADEEADAGQPAEDEPAEGDEPAAEDDAAQAAAQDDAPGERSAGDYGTVEERQQAVREKISDEAMAAALDLIDPAQAELSVEELNEAVRPFRELTGPEVSVLPAKLQFYVPSISCEQLNARPAGSILDPEELVVACDANGQKNLLDTASVLGTDVSDANATLQAGATNWEVALQFTGDGQSRWTDLTREAVQNSSAVAFDRSQLQMNIVVDEETGEWRFDPDAEELNNRYGSADEEPAAEDPPIRCGPTGDQGNCLVAAVLDNEVVTAPEIQQVIQGDARITGDFSAEEAQLLASQLRYGALPLTFEPQEEQTVSATLGVEYLRAGLIAAAIGMGLVLIYSFIYYRLLGIVIFGSLVVSSVLTYAALVVLGRGIGFTLTLAGISGFIVAVGIAADSFVIYFERLKDEIREGRTPRSAVPRAWVRARRTIISANAVTLLAAGTLYLLSAGQVKGFAFALGLATILDLLVVFTFRHPIMALLARTRAFLSPRVSGLGRALELDRAQRAVLGVRTREA